MNKYFFITSFLLFLLCFISADRDVSLVFTIQKAHAVAATEVVPQRLYQASPRAYSWTVNGRTYTNNRNPFGFEIYACPNFKVENKDTCIPNAYTLNGNKYWDDTPVGETVCKNIQYRNDSPDKSYDTRTTNGTSQQNNALTVCSETYDSRAPYPFLRVSTSFVYDSSLCSNGTEVVLGGRSDPNNRECDNLNLGDVWRNPTDYSTSQLTCMTYFDDLVDVRACRGTQCRTITVENEIPAGGVRSPLVPQDVCSAFAFGDGTYSVTLTAYDNRARAYGTSSLWLTAHPTYTISGNLFIDTNRNGIKDAGEANYAGTPSITTPQGALTRNTNGTYRIANLTSGTSSVTLSSVPSGYIVTNPSSGSSFPVTVGAGCTTNGASGASCTNGDIVNLNFGIVPVYTISGNVFIDANKNGIKDTGESNYTGAITITTSAGTVTTSGGAYTVRNLFSGAANVSYTSLPTDYTLTSPRNGPPPSFSVTVGSSCTTNGAPGAACSSGNITNLSFGISNLYPWFQATCGNIRMDSGIIDRIYAGNTALITSPFCNNPGVAFSGDSPYSFGRGQISSTNWIVGGTAYPEVYPTSSSIVSSYEQLDKKTVQARITPTDLASICTLSNCTLPANLPHGVYKANGNVTLNGFTFPANQNYVFLINGSLTINGNIVVPSGSSAIFAAVNNITVNRLVSRIEGVYTTERSFIINGSTNCTDVMLTIAGSVITNATLRGGSFQNNRDLCGGNSSSPTISFVQRLDFLFSLPTFLRSRNTYSWEAAP